MPKLDLRMTWIGEGEPLSADIDIGLLGTDQNTFLLICGEQESMLVQ